VASSGRRANTRSPGCFWRSSTAISVAEAEHADFGNSEDRDSKNPVHCCANRRFQRKGNAFDPLILSRQIRVPFGKRRQPTLQALR
jgi:hypothetical protein